MPLVEVAGIGCSRATLARCSAMSALAGIVEESHLLWGAGAILIPCGHR